MMNYFVHPNALCETTKIGSGTRIWAFAHILPGARIGADCNICDGVFIENDVLIGDRVTVKPGVQLWDGMRIEDDVFIGPNATFANDKFPRSKMYQSRLPVTHIGKGASIGANATVLPGIQIGRSAMIGAGSVVTGDVPAFAQLIGNPARIVGYVEGQAKIRSRDASRIEPYNRPEHPDTPAAMACGVRGVTIHRLKLVDDLRGSLAVGEFMHEVPFTPKRYYIIYNVPSKEVRGEQAFRHCRQFLVCISGSVSVVVDDGQNREEIVLNHPGVGINVPAETWVVHYGYSEGACLLVFASEYYDPDDYIRDYEEFLRVIEGR